MRSLLLAASTAALALSGAIATAADAATPPRTWHGLAIRPKEPRGSAARSSEPSPPAPWSSQRLSNERTRTYWAHPWRRAPIYAAPDRGASRKGRLRLDTEDGFPEVYLLLSEFTDADGQLWVHLRVPGRPNGRTGWVVRGALGNFHRTSWLVVVKRRRTRMIVYRRGHRVWSAPVGVGKRSTPTPAGRFWIREVFKIRNRHSGYYPYAFGTADYSTLSDWPGGGVVGIHGPYHQPELIPGRPSHGCIRLHVRDDRWLGRHIGIGVPLRVR